MWTKSHKNSANRLYDGNAWLVVLIKTWVFLIMTNKQEQEQEQQLISGYSATEMLLATIAGSMISGLLGFLIGFYILKWIREGLHPRGAVIKGWAGLAFGKVTQLIWIGHTSDGLNYIDALKDSIKTSNNTDSTKSTNNSGSNHWYQKPIGIVGPTVFGGVLVAIAIYIIRTQLGIPL